MKVLKSLESALAETGDTPVCRRTLEYIFEYLHHNCYLLKVVDGKNELMKLQSSETPPKARKTLRKKVGNAKTMRVLGCIVKPFKSSTSAEWEKFVGQVKVRDGLYILNLTDALMLKKDRTVPWPILGTGKLDEKYEGQMLPIFGGSSASGFEDITIPNYDDVRVVLGYDKIPEAVHDWEGKTSQLVFRGSSTGCGRKADTNMRLKVVGLEYPWLDAGITKLTKNLKYDPKHGLGVVDKVPLHPKMSFTEQSVRKYILNIDGNVAAYRLLTWMQTGSVIFKVRGQYTVWYEDKLVDKKTVIEVKEDLSDLAEQYDWCLQNDKKCKKIAERAVKLSKKLLTLDSVNSAFSKKLNSVAAV
jgi:hypothetical protein